MLDLTKVNNIYLITGSTDFRLGITGLNKIIEVNNGKEKLVNNIFIFCNKNKNSIKIIEYEECAIALYQKKLNKGKFIYPNIGQITEISKEQLRWLVEGIELILKIENKNEVKYDYF